MRRFYESLEAYIREKPLRLHMPGHAGGCGQVSDSLRSVCGLDLTEVPGIDDLHAPIGALLKAQERAARIYGASRSFYLVNGASSGIHAMMMAVAGEGERVILPRHSHRSLVSALVFSGAAPEWVPAVIEPYTGTAGGPAPAALEAALARAPGSAKALFVTSPSYLGAIADLPAVAELAGTAGVPLCVDEAHGAHLAFLPGAPPAALQSGAVAAVHGLHKSLPVLTQGAILHIGEGFPAPERLKQALSMLMTTSPSCPLMASIELGIEAMAAEGQDRLERARACRQQLVEKLPASGGFRVLEQELIRMPGTAGLDPLKVCIHTGESGLSGYEAEAVLRRDYCIQVEMAGPSYILAMFSPWHEAEHWDALARALAKMAARFSGPRLQAVETPAAPLLKTVMTPRQAYFAPHERVALYQAGGRIAAETVAAYPPGIPCLLPGEEISLEMAEYLDYLRRSRVRLQGPGDPGLETLLVVKK